MGVGDWDFRYDSSVRINALHLTQFRNYNDQTLSLGQGDVHLFVGPNGSGKTNLLEAISILSLGGRSCLGSAEEDLRMWGTDFYRVQAGLESDAREASTLEVTSQVEPRKVKAAFRNDVRLPPAQILGMLPTVTFLPQNLSLFTGPPMLRRTFLDTILSQVSPEYAENLLQYERILRQRSALLKRIAEQQAHPMDLIPWDSELAPRAAALTVARLELIETFGLTLTEEAQALGEQWRDVRIIYERATTARTIPDLTQELLALLREARERDILLQATHVGPHRDDWRIETEAHDLASSGSRGQQRIVLLALLFLEASFLELRRGEKPVILLDDMFSELDMDHQERVLENLAGHQVLLTAVSLPRLPVPARVWEVEKGTVIARRPALSC